MTKQILSASIWCFELHGLLKNDPENLFGAHSELLFSVKVYISGGFHLGESHLRSFISAKNWNIATRQEDH